MEALGLLGLLGVGYLVSSEKNKGTQPKTKEGFLTSAPVIATPQPSKQQVGKSLVGDLDIQFRNPYTQTIIPADPKPSRFQGNAFQTATSAPVARPTTSEATTGGDGVTLVQQRPDSRETATTREGFQSPLTGLQYAPGEFKHNNMVPFFRGQLKQNLYEGANRQTLDYQTGADSLGFAKREQTPFFEPTKEPMGNPFGLESTTSFVESRINDPRNRANEVPVEPIRVGPGLNQGFTHIPSGGFQQQAGEEYVINRMPRTDDLRVANKPKLEYMKPVVPGAHFITTSGTGETIGEVRRYAPDTFYINENGERNFVTTGADRKATARATQVLKDTTRQETTTEYAGPAGQAEGSATYTVAAAKAPLVKQHGPFGFRNADATNYFNKDTDAEENDYGKSGIEIRPNERYYTGERVHGTNLAATQYETALHQQDAVKPTRAQELVENFRVAGNFTAIGGGGRAEAATVYDPNDVPRTTIKETTIDNGWLGQYAPVSEQPKLQVYDPADVARTTIKEQTEDRKWIGQIALAAQQPKLTVYDPNDVARTTIKEQTIDNDWLGGAAPREAQKLTVYDPDDIARVTGRNTLDDWDYYRNMGKGENEKAFLPLQDKAKNTQKAAISAKSAYAGAANAFVSQEMNQGAARAVRHYAQRENIAKGRAPTNSSTKVFNGEDYVHMQYRKIVSDSVNDRQPVKDRVAGAGAETTGAEVLGIQRPRAALKLDISAERNQYDVVSALEANPYVIPLHPGGGSFKPSPPVARPT